jgi:hypothetical protein
VRGRVYAALQGLRGHPVSRFVRQVQAWEKLPLPEFNRQNAERLHRMLAHARAQVPLYRTGTWATALAGGDTGLADWPVLERDVLRARAATHHKLQVNSKFSAIFGPPQRASERGSFLFRRCELPQEIVARRGFNPAHIRCD